LAHLRDPVGREPLLPVGVVRQIGLRQPASGARRITLRDPCRVLPPERRERDDAGVEPDVPDLLDALDGLAALLATDRDPVDPGPPQLLELLQPAERTLLELCPRA